MNTTCIISFLVLVGCVVGNANENQKKGDVLVVLETTNLHIQLGNKRETLALKPGSLIKHISFSRSKKINKHFGLVEPYGESGFQKGWVDLRKTTNLSRIIRNYPQLRVNGYDSGRFPEQIWRSGEKISRAWKKVQKQIATNASQGIRDPKPYIVRGRLWAAVHNREKALRDYLTASKLLIGSAKNDLEAVENLEKLKELFAIIEPFPAIPQPIALDETPPTRGSQYYGTAYHAFWEDRFREALRYLNSAIRVNPHEPLYWYYRALTRRRLGQNIGAAEDGRTGAFWEHQMKLAGMGYSIETKFPHISRNLERVQGPERRWLERFRLSATPSSSRLPRRSLSVEAP